MSVNLLMNGSSCGSSGSSAEFEPWQYEYTSVQVYTYSQRERERERERRHWTTVYYTSPQSFIIKVSYSLASQL